jgi:cell wall-associated NlpC family hydrolase
VAAGTASLVAGIVVPTALSAPSAGADAVASLQQRASALAARIQTDYAKLQVLDEGYNQAHTRVMTLEREVRQAAKGIADARTSLTTDRRRLRTVAIDAYIGGNSAAGLATLLGSGGANSAMQQAYLNAASGDLSQAEANVVIAEQTLTNKKSSLSLDQKKARLVEERIASERALAERITAQLESQLSSVKGRLAQDVAAAERQRKLQEQAAAQAAALANRQNIASNHPSAPSHNNPGPSAGGGSGAVAVRAAESQLGVPYVWGGATPGVGFDCSGLTMWAWGQAGVSLAHGATDQYYEITHVSMNNLQPGDLIFYGNSSYLYHVVMYVGSGPYGADTVIQAQNTGTNVMFTPIPPGAYGAGRP